MAEKKQYTLDRIDNGFYVFLLHSNEEEELLILASKVSVILFEGDIVGISKAELII